MKSYKITHGNKEYFVKAQDSVKAVNKIKKLKDDHLSPMTYENKDAYDGKIGDNVKDKVTGEIWTIKKHYQIDNYEYVQIERNGITRKLKMFADKDSPQDVNRYTLMNKD